MKYSSPLIDRESTLLRIALPADIEAAVLSLNKGIASPLPESASSLKSIGQQMFESLFHGTNRALLHAHIEAMPPDDFLRLNFVLDASTANLDVLHRLPWEALYDELEAKFLIMDERISITRTVVPDEMHKRTAVQLPLRVLVVMASPKDREWLNLEDERREIEESWASCPGIGVEYLEHASIADFRRLLRAGNVHVLHFMGHGEFDPGTGNGALVFEHPLTGASDLLSSSDLGELIREQPALQLAYLNACNTGITGRGSDDQKFSGLAASLVIAGVPAVLAMQFKVTDEFAIFFAEEFYLRLTQELPVDRAVGGARQALSQDTETILEWTTPVLYTRVPDGVLFDFELVYDFSAH
ncbi:MAG: CHAT domain-containing protein [Pseudomonadales bacterium]